MGDMHPAKTTNIPQLDAETAREALRQVAFPGLSRDIVSFGFVRDVAVDGDRVVVCFAPNTKSAEKVALMERSIEAALRKAGFSAMEIMREPALDDESMLLGGSGTLNPLQAEMLEDGNSPPSDLLREGLERSAAAPGAHGEQPAPAAPDEPAGGDDPTYDGPLPVFQWEVGPDDPAAGSVESSVQLEGWEFDLWWQRHRPSDLVYASLRAMRADQAVHAGEARAHPIGRMDAVNLVYDRRRRGIVAIYGTVRDFRPFVEAFRRAYAAETGDAAEPTSREEDS